MRRSRTIELKLYADWIGELYNDLHAKNLRIYVDVQTSTDDWVMKAIAKNSDGIILMNYDQHEEESDPGPVASQDWFEGNLRRALKVVPKQKLICGMGNYGYDWAVPLPEKGKKPSHARRECGRPERAGGMAARRRCRRRCASQGDDLNAHFAYDDEDAHTRHQVWFLDGVTALNEMRASRQMGISTFALWRLGEEDGSLWSVWDHPSAKDAPQLLTTVPPGNDVDTEGEGDILRVVARPQTGSRTSRHGLRQLHRYR